MEASSEESFVQARGESLSPSHLLFKSSLPHRNGSALFCPLCHWLGAGGTMTFEQRGGSWDCQAVPLSAARI